MNFCYACGLPLMGEEGEKARGHFCQYCTDEGGQTLPQEKIQEGFARFLKSWVPEEDRGADFMARAHHYMQAMPAWADDAPLS